MTNGWVNIYIYINFVGFFSFSFSILCIHISISVFTSLWCLSFSRLKVYFKYDQKFSINLEFRLPLHFTLPSLDGLDEDFNDWNKEPLFFFFSLVHFSTFVALVKQNDIPNADKYRKSVKDFFSFLLFFFDRCNQKRSVMINRLKQRNLLCFISYWLSENEINSIEKLFVVSWNVSLKTHTSKKWFDNQKYHSENRQIESHFRIT